MNLSTKGVKTLDQYLREMINTRNKQQSHEYQLLKYQKKWGYEKSYYLGGMDGFDSDIASD